MVPYTSYFAQAGQRDFVVPFPFLNRSHIVVRANGVLQTLAPWPDNSTIRLLLPVAQGSFVEIERVTPLDGPLVEFQNGAVLTSEDLNTAVLQLLYRQQELAALYERTLKSAKDRLAQLGGVSVPTEDVFDTLIEQLLGSSVLDHLRDRLNEIDQLSQAVATEASNRTAMINATRDAINARVDSLLAGVSDNGTTGALITEERNQRIAADNALASQITTVAANVGTNAAAIQTEETARVNGDNALAQQISVVASQVSEAQASVVTERNARTAADSALASQITDLTARLGTAEASVTTEQQARVSADNSLATQITTLQANLGDANARITSFNDASVTRDNAITQSVSSLTSSYNNFSASVTTQLSTLSNDLTASVADTQVLRTAHLNLVSIVTTDRQSRVDADSAISTRIDGVVARVGTVESGVASAINYTSYVESIVANEQQARASADSAFAAQLSGVSTTLNGLSASVTTSQASINGLLAKYSVKLNSNGHITGFEANNDGTTGQFMVVADVFKIVSFDGSRVVTPFTVTADGVRIDGNLVVTGSINGRSMNMDTLVRRAGFTWSGSVLPNPNTRTILASSDLGAVGADGSYRLDYDLRFTTNVGLDFTDYAGLPYTITYLPDGYMALEVVGQAGAILAQVTFNGGEFASSSTFNRGVVKQGQVVIDRIGAADPYARLQLVIYRQNQDSGVIFQGDRYRRSVSADYTATYGAGGCKWTFI